MPRWSQRNYLIDSPTEYSALIERGLLVKARDLDPRIWDGAVMFVVTFAGASAVGVANRVRYQDMDMAEVGLYKAARRRLRVAANMLEDEA